MTPIRKFFYSIAIFAAVVTLLQIPFSFALSSVLGNPNNIDTALQKGGVYDNFVPLALDEATKNAKDANAKDILNDRGIKDVIANSIQPSDVQSAGKSALGGIYDWLNGKTQQPNFTIDLSAPANRAADNLGLYAQKRATSLPPCTAEQMRTINFQEDLLSIPCLPLGITPAQVGQQFTQQAKQQVDLLKDPVIDSKKLLKESDTTEFSNSNIPDAYQKVHDSKWITLGIGVLLLALLVFARRDRFAGIRVVGIVFLVSAGFLLIGLAMFGAAKGQIHADGKMAEVIANTVLNLSSQMFGIVRWFAVVYAVVGIVALVAIRKFGPKHPVIEVSEKPTDPIISS